MLAHLKTWLQLVGLAGLCVVGSWASLRSEHALSSSPLVVRYADAVSGRITSCQVNRQQHLYFLNGNVAQAYNFNAFGPLRMPAQQLSLEEQNARGLGQYLHLGDSVTKVAASTTLLLQRGACRSQWVCAPPAPTER
jgi:hypothetical protein